MKGYLKPAFVIGMIVLACIALSKCGCNSPEGESTTQPAERIEDTPEIQADRKALIDDFIRMGLFAKLEASGTDARLWVTPAFLAQTFDDKQTMVGVVYAYWYAGQPRDAGIVHLYHNMTGKRIGCLTGAMGLDLD